MKIKSVETFMFRSEEEACRMLEATKQNDNVTGYKIEDKTTEKHQYWLLTITIQYISTSDAKNEFAI